MRLPLILLLLLAIVPSRSSAAAPVYLWHEAEWLEGVQGSFAYWTGTAKPTGAWAVAGPGVSPEWTQGGESEWNSIGVCAAETRARCHRDLIIPRGGRYRVWVRHVDHRRKSEPFTVQIEQAGRAVKTAPLGLKPIVPANDEYQLYWGFSFGWASFDVELARGPARLALVIDRAGEAWRQVDAVLLTDDLSYVPVGREKPSFAYLSAGSLKPPAGTPFRGERRDFQPARLARRRLSGRDFTMWTSVRGDAAWWAKKRSTPISLPELFHQLAAPADLAGAFAKQYPRPQDTPLITWPHLLPGFYLGDSPDLSDGTPLRRWLDQTRTPFFILTNYATPRYTEQTGPATYRALTGPLAEQFLGYIHGEAIGSVGVSGADHALGKTRAEHLAGLATLLRKQQADAWSRFYHTAVAPEHWNRGISCLSVDSIALAHFLHESGSATVGYEEDSTNFHVPMRIAFERGAARQYGGAWISYASGNFGDACNYFSQEPQVPRGAKSWFHSKYAVTDGVSACWYRKLYYLNYLGGASAIFWEQGLANQWVLPGPGTHPVQLSPFGRATEEFQDFVSRLPNRGEPWTPIALLLNRAHGYEPVNYRCKMLDSFSLSPADVELRELFNVCWQPAAVAEGQPAAPDVQSMPGGIHGNLFDVLVDDPTRARALFSYPVVWAAGDVDLGGSWPALLQDYVRQGGTLVLNSNNARGLPSDLLGLRLTGKTSVAEQWRPHQAAVQTTPPFELAECKLQGATVLAELPGRGPLLTRHAVGKGAVLVALVPRLVGQDERAHPLAPYLLNGLTADLLPVEVGRADGAPLQGEVLYQLNRTPDGFLLLLVNTRGVDKTPNGVARVDRRAFVDVLVRARGSVQHAKEWTEPRDLNVSKVRGGSEVRLRIHPGGVQVISLRMKAP